jgi:hypothetical protein
MPLSLETSPSEKMSIDEPSRQLLMAIAECPIRSGPSRLVEMAEAVRDWNPIIGAAVRHRVAPMLFSHLAKAVAPLPPLVERSLRAEFERNCVRTLANAAELIDLLKVFGRRDIPAVPFKGVVLGASAWADPTIRPAGDLDLLIRFEHRRRAASILLERGYELTAPLSIDDECYEYHFERRSDGMVVELRWRLELTWGKFRRNLGMDWIWPHRRTVTLAGAQVPDLSPEIVLLMLCMHGSKHRWSRLIWICDIAQLIASFPSLNWSFTIREAHRTGLGRVLALGVFLAHHVAGATMPEGVVQEFQSDRASARLARHFQKSVLDTPGEIPAGLIPYSIQLLGVRDRLTLLFTGVLLPNEKDRAFVPLPKPLDALYYLIRPVRILFDRSPR